MRLVKPHKRSFIFGDLNIDLNKLDSNNNIQKYVHELENLNFNPYSILATHCNNNYASVLHHVFCNFGLNNEGQSLIKSLTITCDLTDHYANLIIVTTKEKRIDYNNRPYIRIYSGKNIQQFQTSLASIDWSNIYTTNNINDSVNYLTSSIDTLTNLAFPLVRCFRKNFKNKCFINDDLKKIIKHKNFLFSIAKHSRQQVDKDIYLNYKKIADKQIENQRKDYYKNLLDARKNSIKSIWKTLNNICSYKKNKNNSQINYLTTASGKIYDKSEIANNFNDFFVNVGKKLASNCNPNQENYQKFLPESIQQSCFLAPTSANEVFNALHLL